MKSLTWDWSHLHRLALRETRALLGAGADAEDAAQEASMRAWRRRATCRNDAEPWMRAIARNEALRLAARRRNHAALDEVEPPGSRAIESDLADVRAAIETLEPGDRLLLLLRYWADLTQPEVARATSLPEGTVKVRLHRARGRLRLALAAG